MDEIVVYEDPVTGVWRFEYRGRSVEVERAHGFVAIEGQVYASEAVRGLTDVQELAGAPLEVVARLIASQDAEGAPGRVVREARLVLAKEEGTPRGASPEPPSVAPPEKRVEAREKPPTRPRRKQPKFPSPASSEATAGAQGPPAEGVRYGNLKTVRQLVEESRKIAGGHVPAFTEGSLRWLIFNAAENGLEVAIVRVGRRVLIDVDAFNAWLAARQKA